MQPYYAAPALLLDLVPTSLALMVAEAAGVILLIGTMLLLGMRRIYIDRETKEATEFEIPLIGKVKTQAPALFLIAAGVMLVAYAAHESNTPVVQPGVLTGSIDLQGATATVLVLTVPAPYQNARENSGSFSIPVPLLPGADYQVKYEVDQHIFAVHSVLTGNQLQADPFNYSPQQLPTVQPIKEISDDELKKLHIN